MSGRISLKPNSAALVSSARLSPSPLLSIKVFFQNVVLTVFYSNFSPHSTDWSIKCSGKHFTFYKVSWKQKYLTYFFLKKKSTFKKKVKIVFCNHLHLQKKLAPERPCRQQHRPRTVYSQFKLASIQTLLDQNRVVEAVAEAVVEAGAAFPLQLKQDRNRD